MYDTEEAVPVATLLELFPEYLVVDGGARASVVRYTLVVRESLLVNDLPAFIDRVLLVDVEQGNPGVKDFEDCVPWDDQGVSLFYVIHQAVFKERPIALYPPVVAKRQAFLNAALPKVEWEAGQGEAEFDGQCQ